MGRGIYTADMGQPPQEPDDASATKSPKRPAPPKKAEPSKGIRGGVWTEDSGVPVPQEPEGGVVRRAKGGSVSASSRADGIAQRGKTRGTMVMCGGGMARGKK